MSANRKPARHLFKRTVVYATLASFILTSSPALAAKTDVANAPLANGSAVQVLPNVMLIFDNSGSMASEFMPDDVENYWDKVGMANYLCNSIYFNPAVTYNLPKKPDGTDFDSAYSTFASAAKDGFENYPSAPTTKADLTSGFQAYKSGGFSGNATTVQAAYYYEYTGTQTLKPLASACSNSDPNSTGTYDTNIAASGTGGGNWQKKKVANLTAAQQQNFANWYSYYRTRVQMMKAAASLAFNELDNTYRVGYVVIKPNNPVTSTYFTPVGKFESTQRDTWFETLFNTTATSYTPLREALARVGRYYAGKSDGINAGMIDPSDPTTDPVQYSCQQNFAILTTDGYWNTHDETAGPVKMDGATLVGNQDGDAATMPRPLFDGASGKTRLEADAIVNYRVSDCSDKTTTQYFKATQRTDKTTTAQKGTAKQTTQSTLQHLKTETQTVAGGTTTVNAETTILISAASSGSTVTQVNINGANRLSGTANTGTSSSSTTRRNTLAANIAANLTGGGYEVVGNGACTGAGAPVPGCASNTAYVRVMAPAASGNVAYAVTFASTGTVTISAAAFSGGAAGSTPFTGTPVQTCTIGLVYSGNTRTQTTTCGNGPSNAPEAPAASCTVQTANAGNLWTAVACRDVTTGPTVVDPASCPANIAAAAGNSWTATTCLVTTTPNTPVDPGLCAALPSTPTAGNSWTTVTVCNAPVVTGPTGVATAASCTAAAASASNSWTQTQCDTTHISQVPFRPTGSGACAPSNGTSGNGWQETTCPSVVTGPEVAASCTAQTQSSGNSWTKIACATNATYGVEQYQTKETDITTVKNETGAIVSGPTSKDTWLPGPTSSGWANTTGTCVAPRPTAPASNQPATVAILTPPAGCTGWPCDIEYGGGVGGTSNTLADVAGYYYNTDLRPSLINDVPGAGVAPEDDTATWQHMTTFTMGLGVSGTLKYTSDYKTTTDTANDFYRIRKGDPTKLTTNGTINWSVPVATSSGGGPEQLDDLWHAAVNGRGQFFSADNPDTVIDGLKGALQGIKARKGSAAAAATSNLEPVAGDNYAYTASYTTVDWFGELEAHEIDLTTGRVLPTVVWSAMTELDKKAKSACDDRRIFLFRGDGTGTDNLVDFSWNTYKCDPSTGAATGSPATGLNSTEKGYFDLASVSPALNQWPTTGGTTAGQQAAMKNENLVNFIRGQKGKEGYVAGDVNSLYRTRKHVLGDIINAQPVFVKAPFAQYSDAVTPLYSQFKTDNASRVQLVYAASNDGMLHAFYAGIVPDPTATPPYRKCCGEEAWAFIPTTVVKNLYRLADSKYDVEENHVYLVDGTPTVGDFYDDRTGEKKWKTLLVAGLNGGGVSTGTPAEPFEDNTGFYALDVTDPENPKGMWEFKRATTCASPVGQGSDCHLGFTFGNPIITKIKDGTPTGKWVVMVTSGYNNDDGNGYLYVLDAATGKILYRIATNASGATASNPSGLNHILNWVDSTIINNLTERVYGVDLLGNVWRFDVNDTIGAPGREAVLIGTAKAPDGTAQPITTRPELAEVDSKPMVFFGTGRLVGDSDTTNNQKQSIYGVIDDLTKPVTPFTAPVYSDLRGSLKPLALSLKSGTTTQREVACTGTTTECGSTDGWVVDLPDDKERVNVDIKLQLGTLVVASNVPSTEGCTIGGYSWLNYLNYSTGTAVANAGGVAGERLSSSLAVGLNIVRLPDGKTVVITTTSDAQQKTVAAPFDTPPPAGKRISWRELSQ